MNIRTIRASAAVLAITTLITVVLAGCSGSTQGAPQETTDQKTKREAIIQQHKDAADNVK